jgi:hypothetical protein
MNPDKGQQAVGVGHLTMRGIFGAVSRNLLAASLGAAQPQRQAGIKRCAWYEYCQ